jgi:hypothetical protein
MMKSSVKIFISVFAFAFVLNAFRVQGQTTNYQVYSLFVINIAKYSAWPSTGSEFKITVLGKSKVFDELSKQAAGKSINGSALKVSQVDVLTNVDNINIIYLSDGKSSMLDEVLKMTQGKSVMIVAEREGLFKKGAGFSFILMDNNTLRFDINNTDLEKRQIKISRSLSSLANSIL